MALILCPECKKEVSDKATNCPVCGYPIAANNPGGTVSIKLPSLLVGTVKIYDTDGYPLL